MLSRKFLSLLALSILIALCEQFGHPLTEEQISVIRDLFLGFVAGDAINTWTQGKTNAPH